jgi:hypothetical protein
MKATAHGSVLVHLPLDQVDRDFAEAIGDQGGDTTIQRSGEGGYRFVSRAGLATVVGEFVLERADVDETAVHATLYVRPPLLGFLARRLMGRRRLQRGVDAALTQMARRATGELEQPEFGPEDFADDVTDDVADDRRPGFRSDTPRD